MEDYDITNAEHRKNLLLRLLRSFDELLHVESNGLLDRQNQDALGYFHSMRLLYVTHVGAINKFGLKPEMAHLFSVMDGDTFISRMHRQELLRLLNTPDANLREALTTRNILSHRGSLLYTHFLTVRRSFYETLMISTGHRPHALPSEQHMVFTGWDQSPRASIAHVTARHPCEYFFVQHTRVIPAYIQPPQWLNNYRVSAPPIILDPLDIEQ